MTNYNLDNLLNSTKVMLDHQREVEQLKGEKFNLFSILGMETQENATHSAFLGELLNPKGSHFKSHKFLELFLSTINYKADEMGFDLDSAALKLEKHIGIRDDEKGTGGRIDIYIKDKNNISISIENKIYAGDQKRQIERYVNHNKANNTVYYLTLEGDDASKESKGGLQDGEDYHTLSYKTDIIEWLESCMKEAVDEPILRESIKQYIILVKKLTNQLTNSKMEKDILQKISENYEASVTIANNVWQVELAATKKFLINVKIKLLKELGDNWLVKVDEDLNKKWTGLVITKTEWNGIAIKLQGQSKLAWNNSAYGINADKQVYDRSEITEKLSNITLFDSEFRESAGWPYYKIVELFAHSDNRAKLFDTTKREELEDEMVGKLVEMATVCESPLSTIKKVKS
jgi:hypothetical protein